MANLARSRQSFSCKVRLSLPCCVSTVGVNVPKCSPGSDMAELAHVNRFATAGELTHPIAHEINQPLGSILTNAETAQAILKLFKTADIAALRERFR